MQGNPIESVKSGIRALRGELMGDPSAVECASLSVITFDSNAQQVVPLTELAQFNPPDIRAVGTTAFGAAPKLLQDCVEREVQKTTPEKKGDWKPLVFIFTGGAPTDRWDTSAADLKAKRPGNIIAVACGDQADADILKNVTAPVLVMKEMTPDAFRAFFKWVSASPAAPAEGIAPPPPQIVIHP